MDYKYAKEAIEQAGTEDEVQIKLEDYIDEEYIPVFNESKKFLGVVDAISPHPCFTKGHKVMTDVGLKNIEDIKVGDNVLTHKQRFKKVNNIMKNKLEENNLLVNIKPMGVEKLTCTGSHPFLVKRGNEVNWIDAKDINKGDYVAFARNQNSIIPKWDGVPFRNWKKPKNTLKMDSKDFWYFVGRYIGDGWTQLAVEKSTGKPYGYRVVLCCAYDESHEIEEILKKNNFKATIDNRNTAKKFTISDKELYTFLQQFGKYAYGKKLNNTILDLPLDLLESFFDGYMSADGHNGRKNKDEKYNLYGYTTVSEDLAYGLQHVVLKLYKTGTSLGTQKSGTDIIEGRIVNRRKKYRVNFRKNEYPKGDQKFDGEYIWTPVRDVVFSKPNEDEEFVYNMSVDEDESYTVSNIITHNCGVLVNNESISKNIGVFKVKEELVALIEGADADHWHYVKNDILAVNVWGLIGKTFERIGTPILTVDELLEITKDDEKTWEIYSKGITVGINQLEQASSRNKLIKYAPRNASELSAFCAK